MKYERMHKLMIYIWNETKKFQKKENFFSHQNSRKRMIIELRCERLLSLLVFVKVFV